MGYMPGTSVHGPMVIMVCHNAMLLQCRCMEITEKGYTAIASSCQKLQVLRMYACAHVNDATLKACGELLPDLRVIDICGAHLVTDNGAQVSSGCSVKYALHSLDCLHCTFLYPVEYNSNSVLDRCAHYPLPPHCSQCPCSILADMHATHRPHLSEDAVQHMCPGSRLRLDASLQLVSTFMLCLQTCYVMQALAKCHKLEVVNFTWCVQLTDTAVCPIAAGCTGLQSLSLHGLRGITNQTIEALATNCRDSLHTLDVHGCIGIKSCEEPVQTYLQRNLPGVKQFVVHT